MILIWLKEIYWKDILIFVTDWLIQRGFLINNETPVSLPRASSRFIIAMAPKHPNGNDFYEKISAKHVGRNSCKRRTINI